VPPLSDEDAAEAKKAYDALPPQAKQVPSVLPPADDGALPQDHSDNSNTQFATLGLWAARRHGVPMERALARLTQRFRVSQQAEGGWAYNFGLKPNGGMTPTMTGAGLLGLAVGHGVTADLLQSEGQAAEAREDPAVEKGLAALSKFIGDQPGGGRRVVRGGGAGANLYFLWSVERVGTLYNLETIGDKEWYPWGASLLLDRQQADGSWTNGGYPQASPTIDTSFALLFLKRANLAQDLTKTLGFTIRVKNRDGN
jgi:hypothetical protein